MASVWDPMLSFPESGMLRLSFRNQATSINIGIAETERRDIWQFYQ